MLGTTEKSGTRQASMGSASSRKNISSTRILLFLRTAMLNLKSAIM
jgi:hypothetical protein